MNTREEEDKKYFQELIEKYLDGKIALEEVKLLVNYYESYQQNHEWVEALGPKNNIKQRMLINILEELQTNEKDTVKVIPFYKKRIFKYIAAAAIAALISIPLLIKNNNALGAPPLNTVITNNNIKAGTNKATLTLEDGKIIPLEKGKNYNSNTINSNGTALVYTPSKQTNKKIAYNYLTIPRGGEYQLTLSDGTKVWLNSESQIKYPVAFTKGNLRQVELIYGEAYFEVSPSTKNNGSKFSVITNRQEIEVLGTEFNIKAYRGENFIYSTLIEGKVNMISSLHTHKLNPNQQTVLNTNNGKVKILDIVDIYSVTAWRKGVFSFNEMPLEKIMKVLSRWYDTEVLFVNKDIESIKFTGILDKEQTIEEILFTIYNTNNIKYEINDKTIIFR